MSTKIRSDEQLTIYEDLDVNSHRVINVADPIDLTDVATKKYVDEAFTANDAMKYMGVIDCSANPNYPAANAGETYKVSISGLIGGSAGAEVLQNSTLICLVDDTASGSHASVGSSWSIISAGSSSGNVSTSSTSSQDNAIIRMDSTSGSVIQTSLATIDDAGSMNIPAGQSFSVSGTPLVSNATHTGDVTGSSVLTIANSAVTLAKMANMPTVTIMGNNTGGPVAPRALTASEVRTLLNVADGATAVVVPSFVTREVISGVKDGVNTAFTLTHVPTAGSESLYLNGMLLNSGVGNDYTISGLNITAIATIVATDMFLASYRY